MKSDNFVWATVVILLAQFSSWIEKPAKLFHWWHNLLHWPYQQRQQRRRRKHGSSFRKMYEFRPFELQRYDYKSYSSNKHRGRGINIIPKPRSGHRIVANETDIFCYGGRRMRFI